MNASLFKKALIQAGFVNTGQTYRSNTNNACGYGGRIVKADKFVKGDEAYWVGTTTLCGRKGVRHRVPYIFRVVPYATGGVAIWEEVSKSVYDTIVAPVKGRKP